MRFFSFIQQLNDFYWQTWASEWVEEALAPLNFEKFSKKMLFS